MKQDLFGILCFSPGNGGLEINTVRLAVWMQAAGWKVQLLLQEGTALHKKAVEAGLPVTSVPGNASARQQIQAIKHWVTTYHIPLLFLPFNKDLKIAARYKRYTNRAIKLVYQQHMQVGVKKRDLIHTLRYKMLDAWISPLEYLRQETLEKTRVPASKIHVVPFGFDPRTFQQSDWTRVTARKAFNLPEATLIIGVLGRLDPKKGQDLVVKGIHQLREKHQLDCHLLLVGDATINEGDAYSRQLKQLIDDLGLQHKVHMKAYQPDVMQFFRAIDIFAMPSHGETFGMVTLEAMAAGVPIVGTRTDGTREILQDGKFGYLFPLNDVDAFCTSILAVTNHQDIHQLLAAASREVQDTYLHQDMCRKIGQVIKSLL
jgi:D-inositol-3-phosphate glycosyltransferase